MARPRNDDRRDRLNERRRPHRYWLALVPILQLHQEIAAVAQRDKKRDEADDDLLKHNLDPPGHARRDFRSAIDNPGMGAGGAAWEGRRQGQPWDKETGRDRHAARDDDSHRRHPATQPTAASDPVLPVRVRAICSKRSTVTPLRRSWLTRYLPLFSIDQTSYAEAIKEWCRVQRPHRRGVPNAAQRPKFRPESAAGG